MRKTTLILAFLAAIACGRAQDFLTPESYRIYDYYENGNETLFRLLVTSEKPEGISYTYMANFSTYYLCAPSFSPEYALIVGKNQLILNKAKESVWLYITAVDYAQAKDFRKRDKEQQKQIHSLVNSFNSNPVDRFSLNISEEQSQCIAELFEHATKTATHLQSLSLGNDGTTHYFNYRGQLASVWVPQGGRTARLTSIANRLCYAVEHQDTAVLNQQMELCRRLTEEFKQEYPNRYFQPSWVSRSSGDKGPWHCELSGDRQSRGLVPGDLFDEQQAKVSFHCHRQSHRHCHLRVQGGLARYHHIRQTLAPRRHPLRRDAAVGKILFRGRAMEKGRIICGNITSADRTDHEEKNSV